MLNRLALLGAFALTVATAGSGPPSEDPAPVYYLPTVVGDKLVMEETCPSAGTETKRLVTLTVTAVEWNKGGPAVTLAVEADKVAGPSPAFIQSERGLYLVAMGGTLCSQSLCMVPLPLKAGTTWTVDDAAYSPWSIKFTVGDEEEVEVPAGKFKAVRIRQESTLKNGSVSRVIDWWAPGRGTVKSRQIYDDGTEVVRVLKSFKPAKRD